MQSEKDISVNIQTNFKDLHAKNQKNYSETLNKVNNLHSNKAKEHEFCPRLGFAVAQINKMFIISQTIEKLIIVDQHAAHERIVLEKMKYNYLNNNVPKQTLLMPEILNFYNNKELLLKNRIEIEKLGLVIEDYGDTQLLVREIPAILGKINIKYLLEDVLEKIKVTENLHINGSNIEEFFSTISCHNSIRAGRKLNIEEMNSLLREMEKTKNAGQCNHGRPTFVEVDLNFIEKLFGRT